MSETNRIVPGATMTFTGHIHQGWEWSYFEADGEKFYLIGSPELRAKMDELYPNPPAGVDKHLVGTFRGAVSGNDRNGPWRGYRYSFRITEILDCRLPEGVSQKPKE